VVSTNGLIDKEANTLLKKISSLLAEKWDRFMPRCVDMSILE
jgi:hypothetical protein